MMQWDGKNLKVKIWTYMGIFAAVIMVVLWLLQIIFLNAYYQTMKLREIEKIGDDVLQNYDPQNVESLISKLWYERGLSMQLIAEDGREILRFSAWEADPRERPHVPQDMLQSMKRNLETVQSNRVAYIAGDSRAKMEVAIYAAKVKDVDGNDAYLCITSSLAPVDATASVLKNQLVIVTIISLVFAFALSYFIAQHIARPISKITKTAGQLAKGNYDVVFEEGDYTEINNLAKVLNYTTKELKKTNELRRDLMANVSHDLRTPLTIIKSYAEMIRDISGNNPEKRTNHANVIVKESDRLSLLVNDILDLSKMEAGTMPLKKSLFDLSETVYGILHQFRVLEESEGYIFRVECEAGMMIYADRHRIEQVIYNLVSNAVNYTGEDKTVYVTASREGDFAKVAVRDTGKGIPPQEQSLVWERYYRASEGRTRVQHGSGIGLSIVKNILLQHEAEHGVISQVGKGSEFWFKLPLTDKNVGESAKHRAEKDDV